MINIKEQFTTEELTALVQDFPAPMKEKLVSNWESLLEEYRFNGNLSLDSISKIIGNPPVIPESHDLDTLMDAFEAKAEYGHMCMVLDSIFAKVA